MAKNKASPTLPRIRYMSCFDLTHVPVAKNYNVWASEAMADVERIFPRSPCHRKGTTGSTGVDIWYEGLWALEVLAGVVNPGFPVSREKFDPIGGSRRQSASGHPKYKTNASIRPTKTTCRFSASPSVASGRKHYRWQPSRHGTYLQ